MQKVAPSASRQFLSRLAEASVLLTIMFAMILLNGCVSGAGGSSGSGQPREDWKHSLSGPFPYANEHGGGHGQTGGGHR
jgi:hypothetical protein